MRSRLPRDFLKRLFSFPSCVSATFFRHPPRHQHQPSFQSSALKRQDEPWLADHESYCSPTESRWLFKEAAQRAARTISPRFNMRELVRVATRSLDCAPEDCVGVRKIAPGSNYNKVFELSMRDGRIVIAKVPHPNAGLPFWTTASEAATMDWARCAAGIPVPRIHAYNPRTEDNPVGAEYIIMDKAKGTPLRDVWYPMSREEKHKLVENVVLLEASLVEHRFESVGGIYYERDLGDVQDVKETKYNGFIIGPSTPRTFLEDGTRDVESDRGPWNTTLEYILSLAEHEKRRVMQLPSPRRSYGIFGVPGCYTPTREAKLAVLDDFERIAPHILPDTPTRDPVVWHANLNVDNVFVNPEDHTQIEAVIDWQSINPLPMCLSSRSPDFIGDPGPVPQDVRRLPVRFGDLSLAKRQYVRTRPMMLRRNAYQAFSQRQNPDAFRAGQYRNSRAGHLIHSKIPRVYADGEPFARDKLLKFTERWTEFLPDGPANPPMLGSLMVPGSFAAHKQELWAWREGVRVLEDMVHALAAQGIEADGKVDHQRYEEMKQKLDAMRLQFVHLHAADSDASVWKMWDDAWPFRD